MRVIDETKGGSPNFYALSEMTQIYDGLPSNRKNSRIKVGKFLIFIEKEPTTHMQPDYCKTLVRGETPGWHACRGRRPR